MSNDAENLRNQARRCRRLAKAVTSNEDRAMLRRLAEGFDEAAANLEVQES